MRRIARIVMVLVALTWVAQTNAHDSETRGAVQSTGNIAAERLGTVSFDVSCSPSVQAPFDRGVALLHDFWYGEAQRQFETIAHQDPGCAMAHWGIAMSIYHQIWNRPDEDTMAQGRAETQKATAPAAKTAREREYIAALSRFYQPGQQDYRARVEAYSAAMGDLFRHYAKDTDAGAFYALSVLAAEAPDDTSLAQEHKALAVLNPLFAAYPDHPGVVHYIIHACDTPSLAADGLAAAKRYGEIAPSGAHAVHMPGHIFARLGMWQEDSTGARIERDEVLAWVAFANGDQGEALKQMRASADLQDKVGQGEVDIPAREMLADMLLEYRQAQQALIEYERALKQSPNRFNGLFNAGMAAETLGDKPKAMKYYTALLESTGNGAQSARPEIDHVKSFVAAARIATN
jgi:tetratricopeptide (TPR) repeat protein